MQLFTAVQQFLDEKFVAGKLAERLGGNSSISLRGTRALLKRSRGGIVEE